MILAQPYPMKNKIQHYAWGCRGLEAFIPQWLGVQPTGETPYAELWIGAHAKAPSTVDVNNEEVPLDVLITHYPKEVLGESVRKRFGDRLPFLLKVLSAGEPLSIQAHPNKAQAERLHRLDPAHYPDDNHKPEIAIALDSLTALAGLKTAGEMERLLENYPEIAGFIEYTGGVVDVHLRFTELLHRSVSEPDSLKSAIEALALRLESQTHLSEADRLFLNQRLIYPKGDVGLFALFFLNLLHLKKGEALFLGAGIPHAYLQGNIIECMANSDNVVRVGLTPKFKDVDSLIEIMDCRPGLAQIQHGTQGDNPTVYRAAVDDFFIEQWSAGVDCYVEMNTGNQIEIVLVVSGQMQLTWPDGAGSGRAVYSHGEAILIPALMGTYHMTLQAQSEVFRVRMP